MKHFLLLFFSLFCTLTGIAQSIIYVTPTGNGDNSGSSWANALPGNQLATAVNAASNGTSFWLTTGTYKPSSCTVGCDAIERARTFRVASGVGLYGGFVGNETNLNQRNWQTNPTILSGDIGLTAANNDNSQHVVTLTGSTTATRLDGLIIQDGNADSGRGGGVVIDGANSSPTIIHCRLSNNRADRGGALYVFTSSVVSSPQIEDCQFTANQVAGLGGAYYGEATTVMGNSSQLTPRFVNCVFRANTSAQNGGGVGTYSDDGAFDSIETVNEPFFVNCLFVGNSAGNVGGAVFGYSWRQGFSGHGYTRPRIVNCTLVGNSAPDGGAIAAVFSSGNFLSGGFITVVNSIVWNNGARGIAPPGLSGITYSLVEGGWPGEGNQNVDPRFVDAASGDYRLTTCSPAINAGSTSIVNGQATDLAGQPRVFAGVVDLGAYELQAASANDVAITSQPPTGTLACPGSSVSVPVSATGSGSLSYQWYKDGQASANQVAGQTSPTLNLSNVQASSVGSYSVLVVGACGQRWSEGFVLTLAQPLTIVSQPIPQTAVQVGSTVVASVSVVGSGPLTYQWYNDGTSAANQVAGQTSATLTLTNVQVSSSGRYAVIVQGYCNQLVSSEFELQVINLGGSTIVYVTPVGAGDQSGSSWANALPGSQLATAVNAANSGTSYWLATGTYKPSQCATCDATERARTFRVASGVGLYGGFVGSETSLEQRNWQTNPTILSGEIGLPGATNDNSLHVVTLTSSTTATRLDGLVIQDGNADSGFGGGAVIDGTNSSPTIIHCRLSNNRADRGGALYVFTSTTISSPQIEDCQFINNQVAGIGGAYYGVATVGEGNSSQLTPKFVNCVFRANTSAQNGGAVGTVSYDEAFDGVETFNSPLFVNCLFVGNSASNAGGAVFGYSWRQGFSGHGYTRPRIVNCTLVGNSAPDGGAIAAVFSSGNFLSGGFITVVNSIVWNNGARGIAPPGLSGITYSLVEGGWPGEGNQDGYPAFVDAASGDYRLTACSSAVNAGSNSAVSGYATDFAGQPRIFDDRVDLGAYELQAPATEGGMMTVKDGNWNDPTVWSCGRVPVGFETVQLRHVITIPSSFTARARTIRYSTGARLLFQPGGGLGMGQ